MSTKSKSIIIGFPIIVGGCVIIFIFITYFSYLASVAQANKWRKLPSPEQKISEIVQIQSLRDVVIRAETGEIWVCGDGDPACTTTGPAQAGTEAGTEQGSRCIEGQLGVYAYLPRGKMLDSCIDCSGAACSAAILMGDNSLWLRVFEKQSDTSFSTGFRTGIILGGLIGLVIWATWAIDALLKTYGDRNKI
jgi:hypothetical protein